MEVKIFFFFFFFHSLVVEKVRIAYLVLEKGEVSHLLHSLSLVPMEDAWHLLLLLVILPLT